MTHKKRHQFLVPSQYHTLTVKQINTGVVAFLQANDMDAGSASGFDFYRLLQEYIKNEEKRKEINRIVNLNRPEKSDFYLWLGKQLRRDDPIGDLARDVYDDSDHPKSEDNLPYLHKYLRSINAIPESHCTLDEAYALFMHAPKLRNISLKTRFLVFKRDKYACQICGQNAANGAMLEIDHKIPVSRGGNNKPENLWTLCFECNRGKRDRLL